jgi:uncharacterized protein YjbJ (UPF0337 family)
MTQNHLSRLSALALTAVVTVGMGCEGTDDPSATANPSPAPPGGAQSAYGKAQERAERLKGQIDDYQQEVSRQADSVFDTNAPRVGEGD